MLHLDTLSGQVIHLGLLLAYLWYWEIHSDPYHCHWGHHSCLGGRGSKWIDLSKIQLNGGLLILNVNSFSLRCLDVGPCVRIGSNTILSILCLRASTCAMWKDSTCTTEVEYPASWLTSPLSSSRHHTSGSSSSQSHRKSPSPASCSLVSCEYAEPLYSLLYCWHVYKVLQRCQLSDLKCSSLFNQKILMWHGMQSMR